MKKLYTFFAVCYTLFCFYLAFKMQLKFEHTLLLVAIFAIEFLYSIGRKKDLPVALYQVFFLDEKRGWSFSYTRLVTSILLSLCTFAFVAAVIRWDISTELVGLIGTVFSLIAALMGIKRFSENRNEKNEYKENGE